MASQTTHGVAGTPKTTKDNILEIGAAATQSFHVYVSDPSRSVEANHYCTHLSADV
jgi:hypothetical protein